MTVCSLEVQFIISYIWPISIVFVGPPSLDVGGIASRLSVRLLYTFVLDTDKLLQFDRDDGKSKVSRIENSGLLTSCKI